MEVKGHPASEGRTVRVRTFGRLSVETSGGDLNAVLRQPKRFALLTYLAVATREGFCRRDTVVGVFWPDLDQDRARAALRNGLYFLRKTVPADVFQTEGDEVIRVDPSRLWCDAVAFDDALRSRRLEDAMELYHGDFLDGFYLNGGTQFDQWRDGLSRVFRRQAMGTALELAERSECESDARAAEGWLTRAGEFAPYDDEPVQRLIALLRREGNRGAALEVYDVFRERLAQLELDPAPETAELIAGVGREACASAEAESNARTAAAAKRVRRHSTAASLPEPDAIAHVPARRSIGRPSPRRRTTMAAATLSLLTVAIVATIFLRSWSEARWARTEGFQELRALVDEQDFVRAFGLARSLAPTLAGDAEFEALWVQVTFPTSVITTPDSATVYVKDYLRPEDPWILLGTTPLDSVRIPATYLRWRIERPGRIAVERAALDSYFRSEVRFDLPEEDSYPGMIQVSGDALNAAAPRSMDLSEYWLDRFEVTNREYARFVDAGGYEIAEVWSETFASMGQTLVFEDAISLMTDRSGHPGPSTWSAGSYPSKEADHPARGLSWYEASAYCSWAGKELPTAYHWYGAGGYHGYSSILALSSFSAHGPGPVGESGAIGPYGHHDLAGNAREWVFNDAEGLRYVLGGAWDSPRYLFWEADAAPPMDRSPRNGFRCAVTDDPPDHPSYAPLRTSSRNIARQPVDDAEFERYRAIYAYDDSPLNSRVDSLSDAMPHWRREFVTFDAAYGGETMQAQMFIPKNAAPPYSVVIFHPGADAGQLSNSASLHTWWFDFVVRSGRAVMYPIYKGTYERRVSLSGPIDYRDQLVQRAKDLQRSLDYLETRADIDADRVAYYGFSVGGSLAPIFAAVEDRLATSIVLSGGLFRVGFDPIVEPVNFLPRAHAPLLMIGGELDFIFPAESAQRPFFDAWGAPDEHKRFVTMPQGHSPDEMRSVAAEVLPWLDRYLGPRGASAAEARRGG